MVRTGTYGNIWTGNQPSKFAQSPLSWVWSQPLYSAGYQSIKQQAAIIRSAGKKNILRGYFWDYPGIYPAYTNWSHLANNPALYDLCAQAVAAQINLTGLENVFAVSISEEEPAVSYGWNASQVNVADFVYGHNEIYNRLKILFPNLRIFANPHVLGYFSETQFQAINMEGVFVHTYSANIANLSAYLTKGFTWAKNKGIGAECYTLVHAATGSTYEPSCDPNYITEAFNAAVSAGMPNIGFYCPNEGGIGNPGNLLLNDYTPGLTTNQLLDPYLHQQVMIGLINKYKAGFPYGVALGVLAIMAAMKK